MPSGKVTVSTVFRDNCLLETTGVMSWIDAVVAGAMMALPLPSSRPLLADGRGHKDDEDQNI